MKKSVKVVVVTGPPGSGKDTFACLFEEYAIIENRGCEQVKFAQPLRDALVGFFGLSNDSAVEAYKRTSGEVRKFMIGLSENVIKPIYGSKYFGSRAAVELCKLGRLPDYVVISDAGFDDEVARFFDILSSDDVELSACVVLLSREGCTFEGDSRNYLAPVVLPGQVRAVPEVKIDNSWSRADLRFRITDVFEMLEHKKDPPIEQKTAYRIVEMKKGKPHTLFHGLYGSRRIPVGAWVRAKTDKLVRDGTGPWYKPGFNVLLEREAIEKYLERFTAPRDLKVVKIMVRGPLRKKEHSPNNIWLADEMLLPAESLRDAIYGSRVGSEEIHLIGP